MIKQLYAYILPILILMPSHFIGMSQQEKNSRLYRAIRSMRSIECLEISSDRLAEKRQDILRLINDGAEPAHGIFEAVMTYKGTEESTNVLKLLLDCKASAEELGVLGTPLMCATSSGNFNAVALLLQKGASPKTGGYKVLHQSTIKIISTHTIDNTSDALALTALFIMHPTTQVADITCIYKDVASCHIHNFDRARQLAYQADVQAIEKKLAIANLLTGDVEGIVAAYAGCYHHVEGHLLKEDELHAPAPHTKALEKIIAAIVS